jgi:hypothetical protein
MPPQRVEPSETVSIWLSQSLGWLWGEINRNDHAVAGRSIQEDARAGRSKRALQGMGRRFAIDACPRSLHLAGIREHQRISLSRNNRCVYVSCCWLEVRQTSGTSATFSLGRWLKIENKEHSEFRHLFQAIEFTGNSQVSETRLLMEFKWSSPGHWQHTGLLCRWWPSISDRIIGRSSRIRAGITEPDSRTNARSAA